MLKIVLDTDVLVSGFISPAGASRQLLLGALDKRFAMLLSTPLLMEYESVLLRPQHLEKARATHVEVVEILDAFVGVCIPVAFDYLWRPTGAHADDELVVETAINGHADIITTFNFKDMQAAATHFNFHLERPGTSLRRIHL